jgi:hypothetical protein
MLPASPESENIWWKNKNRIKIDIDRKD